MTDELKDNLGNADNWLKAVLIVVFGLIFYVAVWVLGLVVLLNLVVLLVTGKRNANLSDFGLQTADYLMQIIRFATLNSDDRPFPFGDWPGERSEAPAGTAEAGEDAAKDSGSGESSKSTSGKSATKKKTTRKKTARKSTKKSTRKRSTKSD